MALWDQGNTGSGVRVYYPSAFNKSDIRMGQKQTGIICVVWDCPQGWPASFAGMVHHILNMVYHHRHDPIRAEVGRVLEAPITPGISPLAAGSQKGKERGQDAGEVGRLKVLGSHSY